MMHHRMQTAYIYFAKIHDLKLKIHVFKVILECNVEGNLKVKVKVLKFSANPFTHYFFNLWRGQAH